MTIKAAPEHFQVTEIPSHVPDGDGAHLWVELERTGMNTEFLARRLARAAGVAVRDVGYAGLKDRHALTRQWFSVPAARGVAPAPDGIADALSADGVRVLAAAPSARKLRRGALAGNRFRIRVAGATGGAEAVAQRLASLAARGAPNYFGPQRFGHGAANLAHARALLDGTRPVRDRHRRGLYLSAARALLFNRVLAARVAHGSWCRLLDGEAVSLDGSNSFFIAPEVDADLEARVARLDVHPSGPMCGAGESPAQGSALALERAALAADAALVDGLAKAGLEHARRALRVAVRDASVDADGDDACWVSFTLAAGAYATVVLRELFEVRDAAAPPAG